jgi:hypothetical protein
MVKYDEVPYLEYNTKQVAIEVCTDTRDEWD